MPALRQRRTPRAATSIDLTVWAWGQRIDACIHIGRCLEVSSGRQGFLICPRRPPRPIDPVPIQIRRFTPRRGVDPTPRATPVADLEAPLRKRVRLPDDLPLVVRVRGWSECGGRGPSASTGICCITCKGVRACGCAVQMECGSCCSGECC